MLPLSPLRRLGLRPPPLLVIAGAALLLTRLCFAHGEHTPSCPFSTADHHHGDGDDQGHHHHHHHHQHEHREARARKLPEELAEEEDLDLYGFDDHHHHHHHHHDHDHAHGEPNPDLSPIGLWVRAMGCSLLVSMASLVCLVLLPVIFIQGKPSKAVVDSLAMFGAGAMLGDAFLHQLPHAFGGEHSHSLDEHHEHGHSHSHSLKDLSIGLSILSGIVLFLLVEKVVRYVEDHTENGAPNLGHGHHHHHNHHKLEDDDDEKHDNSDSKLNQLKNGDTQDMVSEKDLVDDESDGSLNDESHAERVTLLRKRATSSGPTTDGRKELDAGNNTAKDMPSSSGTTSSHPPSSLVFGYLNLFSDGIHNFTDGIALGSAFLLHGSVGGWSRTLFLLAHELPQEVGDFGILVRSGFTVSKALFFNFLSALVALAGTAVALILGKNPGHSSLIEGFTAGGFIYIAVGGVLPEMNNGKATVRGTQIQLASLVSGMAVALCISLWE